MTTSLQVATLNEVRQYARGALVAAGALNTTPAPLPDIEAAAGLLPAASLFELGEEVPPGFRALLKKITGRVLGGLAYRERTVYLDLSQLLERRRFTHGHELGHDVLPWHERAYFVDTSHTLDPRVREEMEQEANAFSADLLFGLDRFAQQANDFAPGLAVPLQLCQEFQTSAHASIRRYVETSRHVLALITLGQFRVHPGGVASLPVFDGQCVQSVTFAKRYGEILDLVPGKTIALTDSPAVMLAATESGGLRETSELQLETRRGPVRFQAESFNNRRLNFVLLYPKTILPHGVRLRAATNR